MSRGGAGRAVGSSRDILAADLAHLVRLVEMLPDHAPAGRASGQPPVQRPRPGGEAADEGHLRVVEALLVTLQTVLECRPAGRPGRHGPPASVPRHLPADADRANGAAGPGTELAAATARYIARDLAARRLSAFTSAEGYRLARALAAIGGVDAEVEHLLAEANTVTLHPAPLGDTVSHSAV